MSAKHPRAAFAAALALSLVALSGCAGLESLDGDAPEAALDAERTHAKSGETLVFDARDSRDPNGDVARYHFDFGDGETMVVEGDEEPRVEHAYEQGGVYEVVLEVRDDGSGQDEVLTDEDTLTVKVDDEIVLDPAAVSAVPGANSTATHEYDFSVQKDAKAIEAELELEDAALLGASELVLRVHGPNGDVLTEETVSLSSGESKNVTLEAEPAGPGDYVLEVEATEGSAQSSGVLYVAYSEASAEGSEPDAA